MLSFGHLLAGLALVGILLWPTCIRAQITCLPRAELANHLEEHYGELPTAAGINNHGRLIELFASADGETWTIVSTSPQALISCIITSGRDWLDLTPQDQNIAL